MRDVGGLDKVIANIPSSHRILCHHLNRVGEDREVIVDERQTFIDLQKAGEGDDCWY